jgi:hypothetical protein
MIATAVSTPRATSGGLTATPRTRMGALATVTSKIPALRRPVVRAQDQINRGWGDIDEVLEGVRMIFIPGARRPAVW